MDASSRPLPFDSSSVLGGLDLAGEVEDREIARPDRAEEIEQAARGGEIALGERALGALELGGLELGRELGGAAGGGRARGLVACAGGEPRALGVEVAGLR